MSDNKENGKTPETTDVVKRAPTASERFAVNIQHRFAAEAGKAPTFSEYEMTLAQHLFLKVDSILNDFETKRLNSKNSDGKAPYSWDSINMRKLALDAVHRIKLGLDALIPNHIHPVPYWNKREGKYDLDLRVGYVGKDFYRRENAKEKPKSIRYELVYDTDVFIPKKKSYDTPVECYDFEITEPFNRGEIIGGFGYIDFGPENAENNMLILVSRTDFNKSKGKAMTDEFWKHYPAEMMYKTLVHRVTDKLQLDPRCINSASYAHVEHQEADFEYPAMREIEENANTIQIDADKVTVVDDDEPDAPETADEAPVDSAESDAPAVEANSEKQQTMGGYNGAGF